MGLFGSHSRMGSNYRYLQTRFKMCRSKAGTILTAEQMKVVEMRDRVGRSAGKC